MVLRLLILFGLSLVSASLRSLAHGPVHEQIARLNAELENTPDDTALLVQRGELYRLHGLYSEALIDWQRVAVLRPDDVTNDLRLGLIALGQHDTHTARQRLSRFTSVCPASLPGQLATAESCRLAGNPGDAVPHWSAAIRLSEEPRPEWFLERARDGQASGLPVTEVLAGLDEGIHRYGPLPALQLLAVDLEVKRGEIDAALARLAAIAERAERKERWFLRRGEVLLAAGRTQEAYREFTAAREALDRLPDKLRRAWVATELRQQIDARLNALGSATPSVSSPP